MIGQQQPPLVCTWCDASFRHAGEIDMHLRFNCDVLNARRNRLTPDATSATGRLMARLVSVDTTARVEVAPEDQRQGENDDPDPEDHAERAAQR